MKKITWVQNFAVILLILTVFSAVFSGYQFPLITVRGIYTEIIEKSFNTVLALSVFIGGSLVSLIFFILSLVLERQNELYEQFQKKQASEAPHENETKDVARLKVKAEPILKKPATPGKKDTPVDFSLEEQHEQELQEILAELDQKNAQTK